MESIEEYISARADIENVIQAIRMAMNDEIPEVHSARLEGIEDTLLDISERLAQHIDRLKETA